MDPEFLRSPFPATALEHFVSGEGNVASPGVTTVLGCKEQKDQIPKGGISFPRGHPGALATGFCLHLIGQNSILPLPLGEGMSRGRQEDFTVDALPL